jgi:hypothetical protein
MNGKDRQLECLASDLHSIAFDFAEPALCVRESERRIDEVQRICAAARAVVRGRGCPREPSTAAKRSLRYLNLPQVPSAQRVRASTSPARAATAGQGAGCFLMRDIRTIGLVL